MLVLGIESTCDETAASLVIDGREILSQVISSQVDLHNVYGGVVPELAARRHIDAILPVIRECLLQANKNLVDIDLIAVAKGPGLIGALLVGLNAAKGLAFALQKPIVGVNHIEAHLYAAIMSAKCPISFPCLGVVLSGGHTALVLIRDIGHYELIGETVDDAIGEAFDKVAKLLNLPYPGGPEIEALAKLGNALSFPFKPGNVKGSPFSFSFSGLKTAVMYTSKSLDLSNHSVKCDLAASFQRAALQDVLAKVTSAANKFDCKHILFGGGVINNQKLKDLFLKTSFDCFFPGSSLTLDNAAMIAGLGYHTYSSQGPSDLLTLESQTRIAFASPKKCN